MKYEVNICAKTQIISVIYEGPVSFQERKTTISEVCERFGEMAPLKILVNVVKLEMVLSLDEQKELGEFLASHPLLSDARIAVLHETSVNPNIMVDIIAFTNGYLLAEFTSKTEAEDWLLEGNLTK